MFVRTKWNAWRRQQQTTASSRKRPPVCSFEPSLRWYADGTDPTWDEGKESRLFNRCPSSMFNRCPSSSGLVGQSLAVITSNLNKSKKRKKKEKKRRCRPIWNSGWPRRLSRHIRTLTRWRMDHFDKLPHQSHLGTARLWLRKEYIRHKLVFFSLSFQMREHVNVGRHRPACQPAIAARESLMSTSKKKREREKKKES